MAVNLALGVGVQYAGGVIPVHRNLVPLKAKATTMASVAANNPNNPASKYGALRALTTTPRRGKIRGAVLTDSAPTPTEESPKTATTISFLNSTGSVLAFQDHKFWLGDPDSKNIPPKIGTTSEFVHGGGSDNSSAGGLLYLLDGLVYWVVAWRNTPGSYNNKVYTDILSSDTTIDKTKFWDEIYQTLQRQANTCDKDDANLGYSAHLNIAPGDTPTVTASFSTFSTSKGE